MSVAHRNPDNTVVVIKSRDVGGAEVLARDVESLPGTVEDDIAAMKASLDELAAAITASRLAVDLPATPTANLAALAALISAGKLQVSDATLEALISGGKLQVSDALLDALISGGRFATSNSALEALISAGKLLVSDAALEALISGGKLGVADASAAAIAALITSSRLATSNSALEALISGGKLLVSPSALEALISGGRFATANSALEALISAGKLLVSDSTSQEKLDSLITLLDVPAAGPKVGYKDTIGTGADVQFDTQALTAGMVVKNISTAGQTLYYSNQATPSSTTAWPLLPGEISPFIRCSNANAIKMRASASSGIAVYSGD